MPQIILFIIFLAEYLTTPKALLFYDQSLWGRLVRRRIDYGDIGSWAWAIITNHRDPTGWVYKDARGIWLQVQNTNPH